MNVSSKSDETRNTIFPPFMMVDRVTQCATLEQLTEVLCRLYDKLRTNCTTMKMNIIIFVVTLLFVQFYTNLRYN